MSYVTLGGVRYDLPSRGFNSSQKALIESLVTRANSPPGAPYVNVGAYGYDIDAVREAVAAAVANGTRHIRFGPGTYTIAPSSIVHDSSLNAAVIPSNFTVSGERGHTLVQTGLGPAPAGETFHYSIFRCEDATTNVVFEDLNFLGENTPYAYTFNHQSNAIDILLTNSTDIIVRRCTFKNLWGFAVHDRGDNNRVHVMDCDIVQCANGINVNANYSVLVNNRFVQSEGIEASGAYAIIANNTFKDAQGVAISAGGAYGVGQVQPGTQVTGNTVYGSTGVGIVATTAFCYGIIANNTLRDCEDGGIALIDEAPDRFVYGVVVANNTITECPSVAVDVRATRDIAVTGNVCIGQQHGVIVRSPGCIVSGNVLNGSLYDIIVTGAAVDAQIGPNACLGGGVIAQSGGVIASAAFPGGIGVGNSAAATALGSVTKKVQIFDADGVSLGYIPVYDAIT